MFDEYHITNIPYRFDAKASVGFPNIGFQCMLDDAQCKTDKQHLVPTFLDRSHLLEGGVSDEWSPSYVLWHTKHKAI